MVKESKMEIQAKMTASHKIEIPGCVMLAIVEKSMSEIIGCKKMAKLAKEAGASRDVIEDINLSLNAWHTIGLWMFARATEVFGSEFMGDFAAGKDVVPEPPDSMGSTSIN